MYLEYFVRVPREARLRNCRDARALLARLHEQAEPAAQFDLRLLQLEDTEVSLDTFPRPFASDRARNP